MTPAAESMRCHLGRTVVAARTYLIVAIKTTRYQVTGDVFLGTVISTCMKAIKGSKAVAVVSFRESPLKGLSLWCISYVAKFLQVGVSVYNSVRIFHSILSIRTLKLVRAKEESRLIRNVVDPFILLFRTRLDDGCSPW